MSFDDYKNRIVDDILDYIKNEPKKNIKQLNIFLDIMKIIDTGHDVTASLKKLIDDKEGKYESLLPILRIDNEEILQKFWSNIKFSPLIVQPSILGIPVLIEYKARKLQRIYFRIDQEKRREDIIGDIIPKNVNRAGKFLIKGILTLANKVNFKSEDELLELIYKKYLSNDHDDLEFVANDIDRGANFDDRLIKLEELDFITEEFIIIDNIDKENSFDIISNITKLAGPKFLARSRFITIGYEFCVQNTNLQFISDDSKYEPKKIISL